MSNPPVCVVDQTGLFHSRKALTPSPFSQPWEKGDRLRHSRKGDEDGSDL
jgi:hypothetical protein